MKVNVKVVSEDGNRLTSGIPAHPVLTLFEKERQDASSGLPLANLTVSV